MDNAREVLQDERSARYKTICQHCGRVTIIPKDDVLIVMHNRLIDVVEYLLTAYERMEGKKFGIVGAGVGYSVREILTGDRQVDK